MTRAILDDHLLRDLLADDLCNELRSLLRTHEPATTNFYYLRLCKSVVSARGAALTGAWPEDRRRALARTLVELPDAIHVTPLRSLSFRMAELTESFRISNLGAEAVAASEALSAPLCVWSGDDGPGIRATQEAVAGTYITVQR